MPPTPKGKHTKTQKHTHQYDANGNLVYEAYGKNKKLARDPDFYRSIGWDLDTVWEMGEDGYPQIISP